MGWLRRSLLVFVSLAGLGFASTEALSQTVGDLTGVTSTLTEVVPNVTEDPAAIIESPPPVPSGGSTSEDGGFSSGAIAPIASTASSVAGQSSTGSSAETPKQEPQKAETQSTKSNESIATMTCGEASQDPRTLGAFLLTLKEGERDGPAAPDSSTAASKEGEGVAGASASGQELPLPEESPLPSPSPEGPAWLGFLVLASAMLAFGVLLGIGARSLIARTR
jgi:hypothetical protein